MFFFKYTCSVIAIHKQNNVISFESLSSTSSTQTKQHNADRVVALPSGCHGAAQQLAHLYTARCSQHPVSSKRHHTPVLLVIYCKQLWRTEFTPGGHNLETILQKGFQMQRNRCSAHRCDTQGLLLFCRGFTAWNSELEWLTLGRSSNFISSQIHQFNSALTSP